MRVLFVCLGNICRSPTAEGVFRARLEEAGLSERVAVDSCGTGGWHIGNPPDKRALTAARRRGFDIGALRARQLEDSDFQHFDYLLAMDHDNLAALQERCSPGCKAHIGLFLDFAGKQGQAVPDPYYGEDQGFEEVLNMIEAASDGLIEEIRERLERS